MAAFSVYCLISSISYINKPFAGFMTYKFPYVGSMGNREWKGYRAGLRLLDRVVAVNGQPIYNGRELTKFLKDKPPGTPVDLTVELKGQTRKVTIPVANFSLKDYLLVFSIPFIGGLVIYALGIIVFVLKPNTTTSWVFFFLCFSMGSYMVTGFETLTSYYLVHFHYLVLPFYTPAFVHLGLVFPEKKKLLDHFPGIEYLIYVPALILEIAYQVYLFNFEKILSSNSLSWLPSYKQIGTVNRFFALFCAALMVALVLHTVVRATNSLSRQRAHMILFGVSIAFLPTGLIMLIVATTKINFPWNFLVFFVLFFPASIAYSIAKHNLFDADAIIKRTVGYVVTTAIVIGAYAVVSIALNVLAGQYQVAQSKAFPILFTLGVILVFNPLRDRIQSLVDRIFFRKEYDYGEIRDKIGGAITSMLDLGQILKKLTRTLTEDMFIDTSSVMLLNPEGTAYRVYLAEGEKQKDVERLEINRGNPLMQMIEEEQKVVTKYDVLEDPKFKTVSESGAGYFNDLHANLLVPLIFKEKIIGLLNLGDKKSGKALNREDLDLIHNLANQSSVAIENARLFQDNLEKQRMEEELAIGRELQMSMLPTACPEIKGFEIAAFSESAREVGGDFYDFIEISENKLGIVIGDVTGKSVSGALVMSASRSIFRMLGEDKLTVSESMIRANRRTKKDIKTGMFVALLYAVLDAGDKSVTLCSAGQTQPIFRSAASNEARLVETEGDSFPLGILEDATYEDTRLQFQAGDKVVLYTDGIVEAMNEQEELFGFDRLLEVIGKSPAQTAEALLEEIKSNVNEFAKGVAQHDDLTVIVVSVI